MPEQLPYSKEIHEIMGRIPRRIVRWGTWLLFILLSVLVGISYMIEYPEIIAAPISVSGSVPSGNFPVGMMTVSTSGYGKVEIGQQVLVKLEGYPFAEYGILKGRVSALFPAVENGGYRVEVEFPGRLTTSYGVVLPENVEHNGVGDIVVAKRRLLERFFYPIVLLFQR